MALASLEASEFSLRTNNLQVCSAHLNQSIHSSRRERKKKGSFLEKDDNKGDW